MQIIHNWLKGPQNFIVGTTLYKTFGRDEKLKDLFAKGETPTARRLLVEGMEKITAPGAVITPQPKAPNHESEVMPAGKGDPVLDSLEIEWKTPYEKMNLLRHNLDKYGNENTLQAISYRKPIAREIKELEQLCKSIWAKRDYYVKEGKLPFIQEKTFVVPTDPIELAMLITNLKRYIRRYRKAMTDKPGNPKNAQLYVKYNTEYKQVTGAEYEEKD